jgi:hypothetical protein
VKAFHLDVADGHDVTGIYSDEITQAGVACKAQQSKKLERLCKYITRPAENRRSLANNGSVVVALKTPYDDGTSHVVLSPMEFIGRLATLAWLAAFKPRVN